LLVVGVGQRGCWHRGSRGSLDRVGETGAEEGSRGRGRGKRVRERERERERARGPKELAARNNGKSSVYLMASNHAILSSTAGLLPRCIRGAGVGSALTPGPNSPPPATRGPLEKEELIRGIRCRALVAHLASGIILKRGEA